MIERDFSGCTLGGEFILLEKIAQGGYAAVYRCEQPILQRQVVVKVLRKRGAGVEERFLREAQLASRLDHPNASHIYAFGIDDKVGLWIAMEYVAGVTLARWLSIHGPMPLEQFIPFFECLADVVQAVHDCEIVHRDLKPENVMVLERNRRLIPKLLDLGIAKGGTGCKTVVDRDRVSTGQQLEAAALVTEAGVVSDIDEPDIDADQRLACDTLYGDVGDSQDLIVASRHPHRDFAQTATVPALAVLPTARLTPERTGLGSLPYMPPEQWANASTVGSSADVYALGVIAYEALRGTVPFSARSRDDLRALHLYERVPSLGEEFSPAVNRVIRRAMAKEPRDRQCSARTLSAELGAALRTLPRGQICTLAQVWDDEGRSPALLLKSGALLRREMTLHGIEREFVAASRRYAARRFNLWGLAALLCMALLVVAVGLKAELAEQRAQEARRIAEATIMLAALEQGRASLLYGEPGAASQLGKAYRLDPAPTTRFMLARALQPLLAERARLASSFGRMWSATFSPDGTQVVTTDEGNAQLWETASYRLVFTLPHGDTVYHAVYSSDGGLVATACGDGRVRLWSTARGTLVRELGYAGQRPRYSAAAMSSDGKLVAASDLKGAVTHVWDAGTGAAVAELHGDGTGSASLAFSRDGSWLATTDGRTARVFDTRTWTQRVAVAGFRLSWHPSSPRLLTGNSQGDVSLWAIPSGARIHHLRHVGDPIDAVAFSPDGLRMVSVSRDGVELVWDAVSGTLQSQSNHLHSRVVSVEFDPSSSLVATASAIGAISIAAADASHGLPVAILDGPRVVLSSVHFDPTSRHVVGASRDGTARIWDASPLYRRWSSPPLGDGYGMMTGLEPDRRFLATGCMGHPTRIWDTDSGRLIAELPAVTATSDDFASALPAVSAGGDRAAIARGNSVAIYELSGGRLVGTVKHEAAVNAVAFMSTGRDLVTGAIDGSLVVTRDGGASLSLPRSSGGIDAAGFLPDGRVVAADAQLRLRIYDPRGALLADREIVARVNALRMSADSRRLVTLPRFAGKVTAPQLWDLDGVRAIAGLDARGQGRVSAVRFVAGGQIVTACGDGAARLWSGETGQLLQTYGGGVRLLGDATLSPDGTMVVGGDGDGMLRFWDAVSARPLWTMPAHASPLAGIRMDGDDIVTRGVSGDLVRWNLPGAERVIEACRAHERCGEVLR